jgi:predicted nucleic acid-binding Zn ribbon protein
MDRYRALTPLNTTWTRAVAQPLCRHARPVALKNGTLTVHADSPVWANLLRNTEQSVVDGLRNSGMTEIRSLHIRVSPPPAPQNDPPADESGYNSKLSRLFAQLRKALD